MTTRRTFLKASGAIPVAVACAMREAKALILRGGSATSTGQTFDFYISTTGNDANAGTLASPWAFTSLSRLTQNAHNVANNTAMKSKRVGMLPGIYAVNSLYANNRDTDPLLNLPSGTSSAWSYLGSSDINGFYSPRTAHITCSPSGTPGGGLPGSPTDITSLIGQSYTDGGGYAEFDGLIVSDMQDRAFFVTGGWGGDGGNPFIIRNCEIYNVGGVEGNNCAGIMFYNTTGSLASNNKIHDVTQSSGTGTEHNFAGLFAQLSIDLIYEYNTVYNCNCGIYDKNGKNGGRTYRYNYIEVNGVSPWACIQDSGGNATGQTLGKTTTCHHNIFVIAASTTQSNFFLGASDDASTPYSLIQSLICYNNTMYCLGGGGVLGGLKWQGQGTGVSPSASVTAFNNIYVSATTGYMGVVGFGTAAGAVELSDYNAYAGGCGSGTDFCLGTGNSPSSSLTLASWQAIPLDVHAITPTAAAIKFSNPGVALTPTGYQLLAGSSCINAGTSDGTSCGTPCDMGAWGNSPPSRIGCDFA